VSVTQGKDSRNSGRPGNAVSGRAATGKTESRKRLGDNLRRMYDEIVNEPVPQEMLDLLARLKDEPEKE
jgi:hypothetical protein